MSLCIPGSSILSIANFCQVVTGSASSKVKLINTFLEIHSAIKYPTTPAQDSQERETDSSLYLVSLLEMEGEKLMATHVGDYPQASEKRKRSVAELSHQHANNDTETCC